MLDMFDLPSDFASSSAIDVERPMSRQRALANLQTPLRGGANGSKKKKKHGSKKKKSPSSAKKAATDASADATADGTEIAAAASESAAVTGAEPSGDRHHSDDDDSDNASSDDEDEGVNDSDEDEDDDDDEAREDEAAAARKFAAVQEKVKQEFVAGQQHLKSTLKHIDSNMVEKQNLMVELIRTREHIMHLRSTYERKIGDLEGEMRQVAEQSHRAQAELDAAPTTMTAAEREPKSKLLDQVRVRRVTDEAHYSL